MQTVSVLDWILNLTGATKRGLKGSVLLLCAHLFWRTGEETRLLHVEQLLDAQHYSFSAGLSEVLLFVTQGQTKPKVKFGTAEGNDRIQVL